MTKGGKRFDLWSWREAAGLAGLASNTVESFILHMKAEFQYFNVSSMTMSGRRQIRKRFRHTIAATGMLYCIYSVIIRGYRNRDANPNLGCGNTLHRPSLNQVGGKCLAFLSAT